ncbi:hypothetical protein BJ138DRAFT_172596 [Hygrophoropsis aurantiaca]|uniref:Uncharacterized protein n=1 Tax=Hygrophoropsis aurantiaca TaxID=72124 RepID=A0ACB8APM0_9AGAM|nr:hypothetical protein BJ138DRAFT_172596 [Hygrophoropsis aurantiaca]
MRSAIQVDSNSVSPPCHSNNNVSRSLVLCSLLCWTLLTSPNILDILKMPPAFEFSYTNRRINRIHLRVSRLGSALSRAKPHLTKRADEYPPYTVHKAPMGPESPPPTLTSTDPSASQAFAEEVIQWMNVPSITAPPVPHHGMTANLKSAAVVAVVLVGCLLILVFANELIRRRRKEAPSAPNSSAKLSLFRRARSDKGKDITSEAGVPKLGSFIKPPRKAVGIKRASTPIRAHNSGFSAIWPLRIFFPSSKNSPSSIPHSDSPQPDTDAQMTAWSEFSPPIIRTKSFLARIPEEYEDDVQSQSPSDIAYTLGLAMQRSAESSSAVSSVRPASEALPRSFLSMRSDRESMFGGEEQEENADDDDDDDDDEDATTEVGIADGDISMNAAASSTSSLTTLESTDLDCEGEVKEEVFELRRAHTTSLQMNKATLLSLGIVFQDTEGEPTTHERAVTTDKSLRVAHGVSSLTVMGGSCSASSVDLNDFPVPPSVFPRIPTFV